MLRFRPRAQADAAPLGGLDPMVSRLLRARGISDEAAAERFLSPSLDQLHDPFLMPGMEAAAALIREAADRGDPIAVYGDYDCDGVCASAILTETLREMWKDPASAAEKVTFCLPDRHADGYGLSEARVRMLAGAGFRLLITVDCGISNLREVEIARRELGMRVIVTDHHQIGDALPDANAVLNPLIAGYPFRRLCGAGVALKLTQALLGMDAVRRRLDLAALATVADLVPLIDENRAIVAEGLAAVRATRRPGLRCLLENARIDGPVTSSHLAYRVAPRINAGGRLGDAGRCVTLLMTRDEDEAVRIAADLEQVNTERQAIQADITRKADETVQTEIDFRRDRAIVVMGDGWESGVVGLAAGKLCERYHWPVIVLSRNVQTGLAVGSCRSIPGVNMFRALTLCHEASPDLFVRFGGHEQAAGLTIPADRLGELRARMNDAVDAMLGSDRSCYIPDALYDDTLQATDVSLALIDSLARFEPTGFGNPAPVFLAAETPLGGVRAVGREGDHLKLTLLSPDGTRRIDGIAFGRGDWAGRLHARADILFSPEKNEYMGRVSPQLNVQELRPAAGSVALPGDDLLREELLRLIGDLAETREDGEENAESVPPMTLQAAKNLLAGGIGVLAVAHSRERAAALLALSPAPDLVRAGEAPDRRGFAAVAVNCPPAEMPDSYDDVILADGDLLPGEAAALRRACPGARLHRLADNTALAAEIAGWLPDKDCKRRIWMAIRDGAALSAEHTGRAAGCADPGRLRAALTALRACGLIEWREAPWRCAVVTGLRRDPTQTAVIRSLERIARKAGTQAGD
ncbi:MAG: single-stranded-DNA-specific exonuclease RecJ [Clostridia bacterium]|nr:single-stranded-DNA-specific exonuclease RecJ [Clostridia bacterium]